MALVYFVSASIQLLEIFSFKFNFRFCSQMLSAVIWSGFIFQKELVPDFLEHCFLIITHGYNILQHTTMREYLESETGTAFGSLLTQIGPTKVIAVENSEKTEYGRTEQQQQIVRMIAANVKGVYTNKAHKKVRRLNFAIMLNQIFLV